MAPTQGDLSKQAIPLLDEDAALRLAEEQLGRLAERQRTAPGALDPTHRPRLRSFGRGMWDLGSRLLEDAELVWAFLRNPRHAPGSWLARAKLLAPGRTFNRWTGALLLTALALGFLNFWDFVANWPHLDETPVWQREPLNAIIPGLATGAAVGLLAALWNDLFRLPYIARRIRRQIRRRPDCILLDSIGPRAIQLVPREDPIEIVPRTELCDEVTPGVLQRKRKDVQIVVGDPGAGKTTALICVAETLARIGVVPVLVPLRTVDDVDLVEQGRRRFKQQIAEYVRSEAQADLVWRWLEQRRRVAILTDDLDRLSPDGERGYVLREAIKRVQTVDLPIVVTARPAGVPAGIAASAIDLGALDEQAAVDAVLTGARNDRGFSAEREVPRQLVERWVLAGRLAEVPYYLELLAQLAAAGVASFPRLPEPGSAGIAADEEGVLRRLQDDSPAWNPWWVYYFLLDAYYREVCAGRVRRWLAIGPRERTRTMEALQDPALGLLLAAALRARVSERPRDERAAHLPERSSLVEFIATRDRDEDAASAGAAATLGGRQSHARPGVSAHEVVETAERLRILERRDVEGGEPQFRHRITQAYLAGRLLAEQLHERALGRTEEGGDWIELLLDSRHPEKLTAHTALTFAALWGRDRQRQRALERERALADGRQPSDEEIADERAWGGVAQEILGQLVAGAARSLQLAGEGAEHATTLAAIVALAVEESDSAAVLSVVVAPGGEADADERGGRRAREVDPRNVRDPEARRDADDALIKLTTAADVAYATACERGDESGRATAAVGEEPVTQCAILGLVREARYVTRWTKLNAIRSIASLTVDTRWRRIWQFARDPDYRVRQAACEALEQDASGAYNALKDDIERLIVRAAARSALAQRLDKADSLERAAHDYDVTRWTQEDVDGLRALGTVLPAIVSGLREDPALARALEAWGGRDGAGPDGARRAGGAVGGGLSPQQQQQVAGRARWWLDALVAIAFQGRDHLLECDVAQGFRADAMRHLETAPASGARAGDAHVGPGWVAAHGRVVTTIGLAQAEHWHAQLMLGQALALYTIGGANRQLAYDAFARALQRGGSERNVLTRSAVRLARTAVRRHSVGSRRWGAFLWADEVQDVHRRQVGSTRATTQLLGDVTILLDLAAGAQDDRRDDAAHLDALPYCLHLSRDRREILGTGCPPQCGWNLCPYKQPPPDEPNDHRGVSRAFCRQQRWIARRRTPRWQPRISRGRLAAFWEEMERRART